MKSFSRTARVAAILAITLPATFIACAKDDHGDDPAPVPEPTATANAEDASTRPPFDAHVDDTDAADAADDDAGPVDIGPAGDFRGYADEAATALQSFYDGSKGLFPSTGWWNSANALTALIDNARITGSNQYVTNIATTFDKNSDGHFLNDYYDDEGWWALAWIDAYDLTKNTRYLDAAKQIFDDMKGGWDDTCAGGIWWRKARDYKNAIANELFLEVAIRLHVRTPNDAGEGSYIDWAKREWAWFAKSGMINGDNLVNDGLKIDKTTKACTNNGETTWTYNQGILIGALVELAKATNSPALTTRAQAIATASFTKLVDDQGVLREPCEPSCGGTDAPTFKGAFMRNVGLLLQENPTAENKRFVATNADWIGNAAHDNAWKIGLSWSQAVDKTDAARQASGLDALNAAIALTSPEKNIALGATATSSSHCADAETADHAVDGKVQTKWCGAGSTGWLELDLGASQEVGRIILRHANASGESKDWNTKDFKVRLGDENKSWTDAATVTGNTRSVTIHRLFPAQSARYVRLEISAAQTAPDFVAQRIDELEVYAR